MGNTSSLKVYNPFNREEIGELPLLDARAGESLLVRAFQLSREKKRWLPVFERISVLRRAAEILRGQREKLAKQVAKEGGKPLKDAQVEVDRGLLGLDIALSEMLTRHGREIPMGLTPSSMDRIAFTRFEPRGVVLGISAFNHPFNLIIHQVIPAFASGCPIIVKPALTTPLSCFSIRKALMEAGMPEDYFQVLVCEDSVTEKLVQDPRIAFLSFIGSARVGWKLRSLLPPGALCSLEHGGVAPVIIDETADLETAIPSLVKGGYYHAGQVCVSVQRIYVHDSILKEFSERFIAEVKKLKTGDPSNLATDVGPLIMPKEVARVTDWVLESVQEKGELLLGGKALSNTCFEPSLVLNPGENSRLAKSEVFGPVCALFPYKSLSEAVSKANDVDFAFQAAVFAKDIDRALNTARDLEGMTVLVNDHTAFRVDWMPFGGYRQSGAGVGGIGQTMREMSLEKMLVLKTGHGRG